ncbi:MAG: DUF4870 domain-containing protein [Flaviflexus sp.]|nr:DUF4870 domain-containing protein [Flaviflexus sp.]
MSFSYFDDDRIINPSAPSMSPDDEKTWAILAHLSAPIGLLVSVGWLPFLGPLLIWFIFKNRSQMVRKCAAASFNFNLMCSIGIAIGWFFFFTLILIPVAILFWLFFGLGSIIFSIRAAFVASRHRVYRYPLSLPILH